MAAWLRNPLTGRALTASDVQPRDSGSPSIGGVLSGSREGEFLARLDAVGEPELAAHDGRADDPTDGGTPI